jgi:hypothetical protein
VALQQKEQQEFLFVFALFGVSSLRNPENAGVEDQMYCWLHFNVGKKT